MTRGVNRQHVKSIFKDIAANMLQRAQVTSAFVLDDFLDIVCSPFDGQEMYIDLAKISLQYYRS